MEVTLNEDKPARGFKYYVKRMTLIGTCIVLLGTTSLSILGNFLLYQEYSFVSEKRHQALSERNAANLEKKRLEKRVFALNTEVEKLKVENQKIRSQKATASTSSVGAVVTDTLIQEGMKRTFDWLLGD